MVEPGFTVSGHCLGAALTTLDSLSHACHACGSKKGPLAVVSRAGPFHPFARAKKVGDGDTP